MTWSDVHFKSHDGLDLYAREYGPHNSDSIALLCLSGLSRNSKEFHGLATRLSGERRLICADYRGRGQSQYASDWQTYTPDHELRDALTLLDHLQLKKVTVVGSSRGGIIAMLLAATQPNRLHSVIFNDIGPVIEPDGLRRIAGYIGTPLPFDTWGGAVERMRRDNVGFDNLSDCEWLEFAHMVFAERDGRPVLDYDPNLRKTMPPKDVLDSGTWPDLWPLFEAVKPFPVTALRGEHSDLLSAETLQQMREQHPDLTAITVPHRGHTPFLTEPAAVDSVMAHLKRTDRVI